MANLISPEYKQALIDKYRDINVDHDNWYEWTIENFKAEMLKDYSINVTNVYFSGFWSQGDGACFEGSALFPNFMDNFKPDDYPMIRKLLEHNGSVIFRSEQRGHYNHENCTSFTYEVEDMYQVLDAPTEFQEDLVTVFQRQLDIEVPQFEEEAIEFFKDKMREVYRTLEKDYEYQVSDEAVWETIVANELDTQPTDEE